MPTPPWQSARRKPAKTPLSLDLIVSAALRLLDTEGLDAVSMRRVAEQLGTGAASLYAHVRNKSELLELILDMVIGEVPVPEPDPARWQEQVKQFVREQVRVLTAHPGIAEVVMRTPAPTGPNALRITEAMLTLLRSAGLPERTVAFAVDLLALYPTAVAMERSASFGLTEAEMTQRMTQVQQYFAELPAEQFPTLVAMQGALMSGDNDERLEFALDVLVQGIAAQR